MDGLGSINWWGFTPALDLWSHVTLNEAKINDANKTNDDIISGSVNCIHHCASNAYAIQLNRKLPTQVYTPLSPRLCFKVLIN